MEKNFLNCNRLTNEETRQQIPSLIIIKKNFLLEKKKKKLYKKSNLEIVLYSFIP